MEEGPQVAELFFGADPYPESHKSRARIPEYVYLCIPNPEAIECNTAANPNRELSRDRSPSETLLSSVYTWVFGKGQGKAGWLKRGQ